MAIPSGDVHLTATQAPSRGPRPAPTQQPGYWTSWQLWRGSTAPDALGHLALRTKSDIALDALALWVSDGRATLADYLAAPTVAPERARPAAALALALAGMGRSVAELTSATEIYEQVWSTGEFEHLPPIHHQGLGQAFFLAGRGDRLAELMPDLTRLAAPVRHYLNVDLANPHLGETPASAADHDRWQKMLSARFVDAGLEPVQVRPEAAAGVGKGHLFDALSAGTGHAGSTSGGPLVTVIMPCFQPDEGLLTSIASITAQTWANLEILVVDDASGPDFEEIFDQAVASDSRARLVRMARNGGSYLGRNAALAEAKGEFITFQDADDWSHPQRIQAQTELLVRDAEAPASRSQAVRAKDDLTHQWFGYRAIRDNASSLMIRRSVIDRIGPFAAIRKGADSEYAERIVSLAGPVQDTGTPLAITRLRSGSLSRGDFTYQWSSPDRLAFKGSYRAWHLAVQEGAPAGLGPKNELPCPVPRSFLRGLDHAPDWDVLPVAYAGDFSAPSGSMSPAPPAQGTSPESPPAQGSSAQPDRVGWWHLESPTPTRATRPEMHPDWFAQIIASGGSLVPLTRMDEVRVEHLVVMDPRVLLLAGAGPWRVRADRVDIWLEPAQLRPDDTDLGVDVLAVADTVRCLWGVAPRWVPAPHLSAAEQAELTELAPGLIR